MGKSDAPGEAMLKAFNAGDLDGALQQAKDAVRAAPSDGPLRVLLAELLCFAGEFDKADQHLETAAQLQVNLAVGVAQFRQVLRGAVARVDFYERGAVPTFLTEPGPELKARLRASVALREGNAGEARTVLAEAEQLRTPLAGTYDGTPFDDFRDADDLIGSVLEVLSADGRYFWVPLARVIKLDFEKPERPRDLLFRPAHIVTRGGPEGVVFIPVLYHGSATAQSPDLRLGRATDWTSDPPVLGVGQRLWLAGEGDVAILDVQSLTFAEGPGAA